MTGDVERLLHALRPFEKYAVRFSLGGSLSAPRPLARPLTANVSAVGRSSGTGLTTSLPTASPPSSSLALATRTGSPTLTSTELLPRGVQYGLQAPNSQFGSVLRARREAPVVYAAGEDLRVVGRHPGSTSVGTERFINQRVNNMGGASNALATHNANGLAFTTGDRPFSLIQGAVNPATARHETGHQIVRALREGSISQAPILARAAAYFQNSRIPGASGFGEFLDETYARAVQRSSPTGGSDLTRWLFNPGSQRVSYAPRFGPIGRTAHMLTSAGGAAYRNSPGVLGLGATVGTAGYLSQLPPHRDSPSDANVMRAYSGSYADTPISSNRPWWHRLEESSND